MVWHLVKLQKCWRKRGFPLPAERQNGSQLLLKAFWQTKSTRVRHCSKSNLLSIFSPRKEKSTRAKFPSIILSIVMKPLFRRMNLNLCRQNFCGENRWESSITAKAFFQQESSAVTAKIFMVQKCGIRPASIAEWYGAVIINLTESASVVRRICMRRLSKKNFFLSAISCLRIAMKFWTIAGWCRICWRIVLN